MKITVPVLAGLVGSLALTSGASALIASSTAVVQDISASYSANPAYAGLQTFAVFVLYQNPTDVMVNHGMVGLQAINAVNGTFFNMNPGPSGDPLGLIPDSTGGLCPVSPGFFALPGYAAWAWDTNLSLDNSPLSQPDPGSSQTPTQIIGGAFIVPPPIGAAAGVDLMIQIAQITMTAGGHFDGFTHVLTQNPAGGNPIDTIVHVTNVPAPGALALLGLAGFVGTRRRRA